MASARSNNPARILVISMAGIGDTLQATPVFEELRLQFPDARIHATVVWPGSAQLLEANPHLDEVHQFNLLHGSRPAALRFVLGLRSHRFDLSLTLHPQGRREYRIVTRLIGARQRLSHDYENRSWIDRCLVTHSLPQDYAASGAENNLRLLSLLGLPRRLTSPVTRIHFRDTELRWAETCERTLGIERKPWLGIHAGSGGTKNLSLRRWSAESWIAFARLLADASPDIPIVAFGGPGEQKVHEQLRAALPPGRIHFPQTPDLRHAAALVARASAFLSVDTAFMHIAAATRVPHQCVIETPTLNPPVEPLRPDWVRIPNPAVGGRSLDFYRYDGRPIAGTPDELTRIMQSVTPEAVAEHVLRGFTHH
jgi:ADP-heptose:LPS heptosyltransferase